MPVAISILPPATVVNPDDLVPIVQDGVTLRATVSLFPAGGGTGGSDGQVLWNNTGSIDGIPGSNVNPGGGDCTITLTGSAGAAEVIVSAAENSIRLDYPGGGRSAKWVFDSSDGAVRFQGSNSSTAWAFGYPGFDLVAFNPALGWAIAAGYYLGWGSGSALTDMDAVISRQAAGILQLQDSAGGRPTALRVNSPGAGTPGLIVNDAAGSTAFAIDDAGLIQTASTFPATTLGAVVGGLPIYDMSGTLVGYLPIYDSIT